jgi:anti-sigma regulatory factor (Ser/Thr protein kinase)
VSFRHEALLYRGGDGFVGAVLPPVHEALGARGAVMVAVDAPNEARLRAALGADAERVRFAEMRELGRNPGRIIPAWREFVAEHAGSGRPIAGVGEPVWPGRDHDELVECERHECLLNAAFDDGPSWWLGCPYDIDTLEPAAVEAAIRSHRVVVQDGTRCTGAYRDGFLPGHALRTAPGDASLLRFGRDDLATVRTFARAAGERHGMHGSRLEDLVLAINELATNSIRHGGGGGALRAWGDGRDLLLEVADAGYVADPLLGRERAPSDRFGGRGLYLVHHLCDLVQMRSSERGTTVRVRMARNDLAAAAA